MGYWRAGFEVVGVDIDPQPHYPFRFVRADATQWDDWDFDVIHASPPCQSFTAYRRRGDGVGEGYPNLIGPMRRKFLDLGKPYIIENVEGAPLFKPVLLCGSSFGLDVRRHRLFESNLKLRGKLCRHDRQQPQFTPASNRRNLRRTVEVGVRRIPLAVQQRAMGGVDWMTLEELSESIPPAFTEHLGRQALGLISP